MNLFYALILGIIEGLTEFLPISSTAHLIITGKLLGLQQNEFNSFFEVFIQSGAILAVVLLYWKLFINHRAPTEASAKGGKSLIINLFISFIPTAIAGFMFYQIIKTIFFKSILIISYAMLSIGILFIIVEWLIIKKYLVINKPLEKLTCRDSFLIGFVQAIAIIPGVSRAGAVIIIMLFLGYNRKEAAIYSFLLAVPTILAASIFDLIKTDWNLIIQPENIFYLLIGFVTSFITAYFIIKWFIKYLQNNSLTRFGIYRIILSILTYFF